MQEDPIVPSHPLAAARRRCTSTYRRCRRPQPQASIDPREARYASPGELHTPRRTVRLADPRDAPSSSSGTLTSASIIYYASIIRRNFFPQLRDVRLLRLCSELENMQWRCAIVLLHARSRTGADEILRALFVCTPNQEIREY